MSLFSVILIFAFVVIINVIVWVVGKSFVYFARLPLLAQDDVVFQAPSGIMSSAGQSTNRSAAPQGASGSKLGQSMFPAASQGADSVITKIQVNTYNIGGTNDFPIKEEEFGRKLDSQWHQS